MTKFYDANPPYIKADPDKVLCDGTSMTGLGGKVYGSDTVTLDAWQEMTQAEAEAICVVDGDEEISDEELGAMVREVL